MRILKTGFFIILVVCCTTSITIGEDIVHTVRPGETLSRIAQDVYGPGQGWRWVYIYRVNKSLIQNANVIQVGWRLTIPDVDIQKEEASPTVIPSRIKLVTGNDYPPFTDENLPDQGMITEIVEKAFKKLNQPISIEWWGWKQAFDATEQGHFIATFPWLKNKKRMQNFYYSRPLAPVLILAFVKKDSNIVFNKREDLHGKVFCKEEGYYRHDIQDLLDSGKATLVTVPDKKVEKCFEKLEKGEVDIVPLDELVAEGLLKKYGYNDKFKALEKALHKDTLHLIFSKRDQLACRNLKVMYDFNQVVDEMDKDGDLEKIQRKHLKWHRLLNK